MIRSLYTSVSGLVTLENKQNTITNNITNVNTNGFKSDDLIVKSFDEVLISNNDKNVNGQNVKVNLGNLSLGAEVDTVTTKFTQGLLKETSKTTDFAVDGRGFFTVQRMTPGGSETYFTRDGNFRVGNNGYLMTASGDFVLGNNSASGTMEPIFVGSNNFVIDINNNILINGTSTHSLATADFQDYSTMKKVGDNLYSAENPIYNAEVWVHQGFLEGSNVSLSDQMTEMISTMRNFESNQKMVQIIDSTLSKAANEIGRIK